MDEPSTSSPGEPDESAETADPPSSERIQPPASEAPARPPNHDAEHAGDTGDAGPSPPARPDGAFERRDPRALGLDLTVGGLVLFTLALVALGVAALLFLFVQLPAWIFVPAVVVPSALTFPLVILPRLQHRRYRYRADERGLEIRQGVWWRSHRFIPRSRLQHSDLAQGPLQRRLGLASLIVHTAGTHEAETKIEGLALETAKSVRDRLTGATAVAAADAAATAAATVDDESDGV